MHTDTSVGIDLGCAPVLSSEWVTQMLRQGEAQVLKKYSEMRLQMRREAREKLNRRASEMAPAAGEPMRTVAVQ